LGQKKKSEGVVKNGSHTSTREWSCWQQTEKKEEPSTKKTNPGKGKKNLLTDNRAKGDHASVSLSKEGT